MYNKIRLSSCVKKTVEPYIIRNGGWVTPQLDNILEKARLDQLQGQLLELRGKSKKHKTPKRYTVYILPCTEYWGIYGWHRYFLRLEIRIRLFLWGCIQIRSVRSEFVKINFLWSRWNLQRIQIKIQIICGFFQIRSISNILSLLKFLSKVHGAYVHLDTTVISRLDFTLKIGLTIFGFLVLQLLRLRDDDDFSFPDLLRVIIRVADPLFFYVRAAKNFTKYGGVGPGN